MIVYMKAVVQRVKKAKVVVGKKEVGKIEKGYLVFIGIGEKDREKDIDYLAKKIAKLRIMEDREGKMNLGLKESKGKVLVVSQFTLYGDTKGQNRPSFVKAAGPKRAEKLYNLFIKKIRNLGIGVEKGVFGAKMEVKLINDGPVTIIIES